jgi:exopolysaccharide biosynthesis polyprenyl glycosylphosphotransferase
MNGKFDKLAPGVGAKLNLAFDLAFVLLTFLAALTSPVDQIMPRVLVLISVATAAWFCAVVFLRLYSPCTPRTRLDSIVLIAIAAIAVSFSVAIVDRLLYPSAAAALSYTTFGLVLAGASSLCRLIFLSEFSRIDEALEDVLIAGTGPLGVATYYRLTENQQHGGRRVIGFLRFKDDPPKPYGVKAKVFGGVEQLMEALESYPVTEVYIAGRVMTQGGEMQEIATHCERVGLPFAVPVHSLRFERATLLSTSKNTDGYLHYLSTKPLPVQYAIKRLIDIVASFTALVLLSPLLIGVAIAIKITSPGPVLFKQVRVGLHGARFNLFKFRSMVVNAEALKEKLAKMNEQTGPVFKMKRDPRITGIGRFIRKYSIDELPQLVNILRGDMTIVGPRPALPSEVAQYKIWQRRRLSVRPGLTCYWQVGGRNEIGFEEWMRLDLRYVDHWSLGVDVRLILATVPVVLAGRGAS